jgi:hypothetical protein
LFSLKTLKYVIKAVEIDHHILIAEICVMEAVGGHCLQHSMWRVGSAF